MIDTLFQYYLERQDELVKMYNGKYIVISHAKEVKAYDDENKAYFESVRNYGAGNFLLQLCTPGKQAYTQYCYSPRIIF